MGVIIDTNGVDGQHLQRDFDRLWREILTDDTTAKEAERITGVDITLMCDELLKMAPNHTLSTFPSPIKITQESEGFEDVLSYLISIHQQWPWVAGGAAAMYSVKKLPILLQRFMVLQITQNSGDRIKQRQESAP